jgi:phytanoyl-CoA hydroxylase
MQTVSQVYDEIRKSEMNDWVGGSDPELVGEACLWALQRYLQLRPSSRLLDFGCGVGRVMLSVLKYHPDVGHITGFDIMPQVIRFCDSHIASAFPQASFELIAGSNDHYDHFIAQAGQVAPKTHQQLQAQYTGAFSGIYAFSVFTHVELADLNALLRLLSSLTAPGGQVLFTAFMLTPATRRAIGERRCRFPFAEGPLDTEGDTFVGNPRDRLGFIAFDHSLIERATFDAGLNIHHIEYGSWAGTTSSASLQDVIVCGKPHPLSPPVPQVALVERERARRGNGAAPTAAPVEAPSAVADVHALLALEGEPFVRAAYATVLHRDPDSEGLAHYLGELAAGVPKIEVVSRLRKSAEGRQVRQALPGFRQAWLKSRFLTRARRQQFAADLRPSTATYHSKFGGTWIDRSDFAEQLERRTRSGTLSAHVATPLRSLEQRGVAVLERAASEEELTRFERAISEAFRAGHRRLICQNPGDSTPRAVTAGMNRRGIRIVDSYGALPQALDLLSSPPLVELLHALFEQRPKLFQSLSFDTGSEQGFHQDTAYVVVDRPMEMVGCWIALEDVQPGSGELQYIIGSHRLGDFDFGGDNKHWRPTIDSPDSHGRWGRWLREESARRGLKTESFIARRGDILVWHADLAHGGASITRPELTRKSLVGHFCPENALPAYVQEMPLRARSLTHRGIAYCSWHYDLKAPQD